MNLDLLFNGLQFLGGIILSFGYIPQIYKTIKTKSVEDFSLTYFINLFIGIFLMELYAIYNALHGVAGMFLVTNTIAISCEATMLFLILLYRHKNKKANKKVGGK